MRETIILERLLMVTHSIIHTNYNINNTEDQMTFSKYASIAIALFFISLIITPMAGNAGTAPKWRFPAEFEKQEAVWVGWITTEYVKGYETDPVLLQMVKELEPHVKVKICVPNEQQKAHVKEVLAKNKINKKNISYYTIP